MSTKNELVVKSNRLIEASYRLDLAEQRLVLLAIVRARETGKGLNAVDFVPITAKDYAERFEVDEKNAYRQLKEAEDSLFYREFTLYDTDPETGNRRTIKGRWISAATYIDGSGTIQLQFSGVILPYITNLEKKFTRYELEKVAKMSSPYAIRLYELLMQWSSRGSRDVELGWLRQTLMVPEDEYPRLFDFKKRVIDISVSQINEFSDLTVRYEQRKTGRNVTHFTFTFEPKESTEPPQAPPEATDASGVRDSPFFQRLRNLGIGPKLAAAWTKQNEARALAALDYVESKIQKGEIKGSAAGYLRTVFESEAELGPSAFEADAKAQAKQEAEARKRAEAEQRAQAKAEREALNKAKAAVKALPALERLVLSEEYRQGAGAGRSASWDAIKGDFRDPLERIQFNAWLQTKFKESA
jgi:hypothetical protein